MVVGSAETPDQGLLPPPNELSWMLVQPRRRSARESKGMRRRVESWAGGSGRLRASPTPLMMAASSASEKGPDGGAADAEGELEACEERVTLLGGLLADGVPPGRTPCQREQDCRQTPESAPAVSYPCGTRCFAGPRAAIASLLSRQRQASASTASQGRSTRPGTGPPRTGVPPAAASGITSSRSSGPATTRT